MEFCKPPRQVLRPEGDRQSPLGARKSLDNMTAAPLVVPVSVPVAPANHPPGSKVGALPSSCCEKSPQILTPEELGLRVHSSIQPPVNFLCVWPCAGQGWGHCSDHNRLAPVSWGSQPSGVERPIPGH